MTEPVSGTPVQTVTRSWSAQELMARKTQAGADVWADGDELTFVYEGKADEVRVCCGIELPMQRVPDSDLWVLTVRVEDLAHAVISYAFFVTQNEQPIEDRPHFTTWRGPQAPPPVAHATALAGRIQQYALESAFLKEERDLTVYLPPGHDPTLAAPVIYVADGQSVPDFAAVLEPLITQGTIPPLVLVGAHSPTGPFPDPSQDLRAQEYLPDHNLARFQAHERFFTEEVPAWAERELGVATDPAQRAVFGFSNGGVFAAAMGLRHPNRYGHSLAFSLGMPPGLPHSTTARFYLVAGTLEPGFHSRTQEFAGDLADYGVDHVFRDRVSGHDSVMWQEEFPKAVQWAFGQK
ncbi:MAG TPA: alpha/beta hydrolase-fold protein [Herpetosiphonaceae bacterium]